MARMSFTFAIFLIVCVSMVVGQSDVSNVETKSSPFNDIKLVCQMDMSCSGKDTCELPCRVQGSATLGSSEVITTASFIDEEFEELWDEMQDKMEGLNDHQAELIAQQHDLLSQQQKLEFENRKLKKQQTELLDRQKTLEEENKRLKTLVAPGTMPDEELLKLVKELETKIKVLTEQQQKLSQQQSRLVEQQNRLMQRQRKLEQENANLKKRQERIEELQVEEEVSGDGEVERKSSKNNIDPIIESKLESIKKEMEYRISQLTGQQGELLKEQTKLIKRQSRLEEENETLKEKQVELHNKQEELEKENEELRANLSRSAKDPKERGKEIVFAGGCEIRYQDICFGLLGDGTDELTRELAEENCRAYGGSLANIYNQPHYDLVKNYFLKKDVASGVWLGMKYNPMNYKMYFSDGLETSYVNWNFVYPMTEPTYTGVYLFIDTDPDSYYSGMVNIPPDWKYPYALCQSGAKDRGGNEKDRSERK